MFNNLYNKGGKAMRSVYVLCVVLFAFCFMTLILPAHAQRSGPKGVPPENVIKAEPVHGITVGPRKRLWVFVFPERGEQGKKPPKDDPTTCPADSCTDDNDQNKNALLGFKLPSTGLTFNINNASIPINASAATSAIEESFTTWETAVSGTLFTVNSTGGESRPAEDGNNTVGWVKIVPKNTLAAAWIWTTNGIVTDADIFYNLFHKWGALSFCDEEGVFDVGNVCTHEVGHVVGLAHVKDDCAMATMFPSASNGETKKRTLTTGDINGANAVAP